MKPNKAILMFPDVEQQGQANDLVSKIIAEKMAGIEGPSDIAAYTLPTLDGGSVVAYVGNVLSELGEAGITYRRVGLDELPRQMERSDFEDLAYFLGASSYAGRE